MLQSRPERKNISKTNFIFLVIEEIFYYSANAFYDVSGVIPVFIDKLTSDMKLAGLSFTIRNILFILPQLIMGFYTMRMKSRPSFMKYTAVFTRIPLFIFLFILLSDAPPITITISILTVCGFLGLADGLFNVPWLDFIGDTISKHKRGKLFAFILFFGGIGGMLSGFIITFILNLNKTVKIEYFLIFGLGAFLLFGSTTSYFFMKEDKKYTPSNNGRLKTYLTGIPDLLIKNRDFCNLMLTLLFNYFSNLALPLFIVFGTRIFNLSESSTSVLIFAQIAGMVTGGGAWGYLCYRFSDKFSIQTTIVTNITLPALAMFSIFLGNRTIGFFIFCVISFGAGAAFVAWPGFVNYVISNVRKDEKAMYIGILNSLTLPLTFLSFLGGFLAEKYGCSVIFFIVLVMCLLALIFSFRLKNISSWKEDL